METKSQIPSFRVKVVDQAKVDRDAYLEPADESDMPANWTFDWKNFWKRADWYCEAFIKLSYKGEILGLVRFALYPAHTDSDFEYLEILHLETVPRNKRTVNPVGFWLIWYACLIGIRCCSGQKDETLIRLDSVERSIPYYEDKVTMDPLGYSQLAPGEDGYAFRFTKEGAKSFCGRQTHIYGCPVKIL